MWGVHLRLEPRLERLELVLGLCVRSAREAWAKEAQHVRDRARLAGSLAGWIAGRANLVGRVVPWQREQKTTALPRSRSHQWSFTVQRVGGGAPTEGWCVSLLDLSRRPVDGTLLAHHRPMITGNRPSDRRVGEKYVFGSIDQSQERPSTELFFSTSNSAPRYASRLTSVFALTTPTSRRGVRWPCAEPWDAVGCAHHPEP